MLRLKLGAAPKRHLIDDRRKPGLGTSVAAALAPLACLIWSLWLVLLALLASLPACNASATDLPPYWCLANPRGFLPPDSSPLRL